MMLRQDRRVGDPAYRWPLGRGPGLQVTAGSGTRPTG